MRARDARHRKPPTSSAGARLIVSITDADTDLSRRIKAAFARGADLVELRVDLIGDVDAVVRALEADASGCLIVTIRSAEEGGAWDGDEDLRIALYERLGLLTPGYLDIELATWQRSANLRQKLGLVCEPGTPRAASPRDGRVRNTLILSTHDFRGVPDNLAGCFEHPLSADAGVIKFAFQPRDATDALRILAHARSACQTRPTVAIAMGHAGICTRVLAPKFGAFASFAALEQGAESAPGQVPITDLIEVFRWREIGAATRSFGLIGWPTAHSRGWLLHNQLLAADAIDAVYLPFPVAPGYRALASFLDTVTASPWLDAGGFSVTVPHKEHVVRYLENHGGALSDDVRRCGAANTLVKTTDGWRGENTDVLGVRRVLEEGGYADVKRVAVLGAGGIARAVLAALSDKPRDVTVYNRTPERAAALAEAFGVRAEAWEGRNRTDVRLYINCTTLGMTPEESAMPITPEQMAPGAAALDTVYTPAETSWLKAVRASGRTGLSGVNLFVAQAAAQHRLWHGVEPSVEVLRAFAARLAASA